MTATHKAPRLTSQSSFPPSLLRLLWRSFERERDLSLGLGPRDAVRLPFLSSLPREGLRRWSASVQEACAQAEGRLSICAGAACWPRPLCRALGGQSVAKAGASRGTAALCMLCARVGTLAATDAHGVGKAGLRQRRAGNWAVKLWAGRGAYLGLMLASLSLGDSAAQYTATDQTRSEGAAGMGVQPAREGSCPNLLHEQQPQVTAHPAGGSLEAKTLQVLLQAKYRTLNGDSQCLPAPLVSLRLSSCKSKFALVAGLALSEVIVVLVCVINHSLGKFAVEGLQHKREGHQLSST